MLRHLFLFSLLALIANKTYGQDSTTNTNSKSIKDTIHKGELDRMPMFGNCKKIECSDTKLIGYIYKHLKYPKEAKKNGTEGRAYIQYVVEKDGSLSNIKIVRDLPYGCGAAALEVVKKMKDKWSPGIYNNEPVRVLYTLPVTFS